MRNNAKHASHVKWFLVFKARNSYCLMVEARLSKRASVSRALALCGVKIALFPLLSRTLNLMDIVKDTRYCWRIPSA